MEPPNQANTFGHLVPTTTKYLAMQYFFTNFYEVSKFVEGTQMVKNHLDSMFSRGYLLNCL